MSAETQKVDVLANIKDAIKRTSPTTHFNERANLWATHDATAELLAALRDYFGPMDDPIIGWCNSKPSHPNIFKCEKCGAEHLDCMLIPHISACRAVRLRDAMVAVIGDAP